MWHMAEVHHFWATIVRDRLTDVGSVLRPERPAPEDLVTFAEASAAALTDALGSADPATSVWTWSARQDVGFVVRRMAHETAVHRWDAEQAVGRGNRLDPALAGDGIDEFLEHFRPDVLDDAPVAGGSVHLHCLDVDGEWTVGAEGTGTDAVTRQHAKADVALRGDAHDLLLVLWRRTPLATVEVLGDRAVAERFVARTDLT
jgi:uncharacterized protein (TIGR03083 family)